jgi:biopolymer transport protein TolQ
MPVEEAIVAVELGSVALDFSPWGMFVQADSVVKAVLIILLIASVWCWAIIFQKTLRYRRVNAKAEEFEQEFWSGKSLDELHKRIGEVADHPLALLFTSAMNEWRRSVEKSRSGSGLSAALHERVEKVMRITVTREMERLESYLGVLATVGSIGPFVGLFGTVWGIMNSFQAIAASHNTSLAVVAPGIAEALFATALGLVAAIPAVVAYNKFNTDMSRYANRLDGFAHEFSAILSRQIDEGA